MTTYVTTDEQDRMVKFQREEKIDSLSKMLEKNYDIPEDKIDVFIFVYFKAHKLFQDIQQVKKWLILKNPWLKRKSPVELIREDNEEIIYKYLDKKLDEMNNGIR